LSRKIVLELDGHYLLIGKLCLTEMIKPAHTLHARTKAYAKDYFWKSWWCILSTAVLLAAASLGGLPILPVALRVVCSLLAGLLTVRLFVIYHDHQHHALLPRSWLAELLMRLYGIWVLCPSSIWRDSHDHHHAHNSKLLGSHIGSFPIMTKEQFQKSSRGERFKYLFVRHPLTILFGYVSVFLFGMVIHPLFSSPRRHYDCLLALALHVALAGTLVLFFGWWTMLLVLIIPRLLGGALGSYLFYCQHNFPGVVFKAKGGWTFEKAALDSSSHLRTGPIMGWFSANIGYHHIHHLNHRVPFYRLPEVYQAIPELRRAKTTTLHPFDIFRCLRLKVWCVETQRMVGVQGL
jgi:omega-6 fatty acid desaturase (delta-12 desaturase)